MRLDYSDEEEIERLCCCILRRMKDKDSPGKWMGIFQILKLLLTILVAKCWERSL